MNSNRSAEESTFAQTLRAFNESSIDSARTTSRYKVAAFGKSPSAPILYRHYVHHHNDASGFEGYAPQTLSYCALYIFQKGKLGFLIDSRLYTPGYGEIIFLPSGQTHSVFYYALEDLDYYEIDFPRAFFDMLPDDSPFHQLFYTAQNPAKHLISLDRPNTEHLLRLLDKCDSLIKQPNINIEFSLYSLFIRLTVLICDGRDLEWNAKADHKTPQTLETALKYITDNYLTLNDTKQIAEHCHISVSYLCRMFKQTLGTTPIEYINSQKISHAKNMLRKGCNVTEACFSSGFNSYNYFISTFKKAVGKTPAAYRRQEFQAKE